MLFRSDEVMVPVVEKCVHSAIDYDVKTSTVYYFDATNFRIMKKTLTALKPETYMAKVAHSEGIAIDWMGRNLYWADDSLNVIHVAALDNPEQKKLLVSNDLERVKSIAVHPQSGYMFWSSWATGTSKTGVIERAWMTGDNREKWVQALMWPLGLTIDPQTSFLYWADSHQFTIERIRINNINSREV